jgi:uncharacterized protein YlxW (UPF0749 family)
MRFDKKANILILALLIGLLLSLQMKNDAKTYAFININTVATLSNELDATKKDIVGLKALIRSSGNELNRYEMLKDNDEDMQAFLRDEIFKTKAVAGYTNVIGEGILVRLADNLEETQRNINFDLVHDVDIAMILNDLINSGAEAISINGKRILSKTEIICIGPLIRINGEGVGAPFIIKAIGNKDQLFAALNAPHTYAYNLRESYGLEIETMKSDFILIPKYSD